jgi:Domain of unknown function (DUF2017)
VAIPFRRKFPFAPTKDGRFSPNLSDDERDLLADLPNQLRELLGADDAPFSPEAAATAASTKRLFPVAYTSDPERNADYQSLMREDLVASKLAAAQVLSDTARAVTLSEDQMMSWMGAINDLRLVIGTQLDVQEDTDHDDIDPEDPDAYRYFVYRWLSMTLEMIVRALTGDSDDLELDDLEI